MKNLSFFFFFLPDRPTQTLAKRNKFYVLPLFFFFFFTDRPTAGKHLVKNPPFKESTEGRLRLALRAHGVECYL